MPRVGLTPERVVQVAADVADETGLERLTLAAVAKRCGVSLPGLYKHVDGLDAVKRGVAMLAVEEMTARLAAAVAGVTGREALAELSAAYRAYAARLKKLDIDQDPAAFARLREALEWALAEIDD